MCAAVARAILLSAMDGELDAAVVRRLLDFAAHTTDLVGVVDGSGRMLFVNDAARKQLGLGDSNNLTTADLFMPEAFETYFAKCVPRCCARERGRVSWSCARPMARAGRCCSRSSETRDRAAKSRD
jgi:hypothetical protein